MLTRPILFSDWLNKQYLPVPREELRKHIQSQLAVFKEEELDVDLVLFDDVMDHILRLDRVFKQRQGHVLAIGISGGGKSLISRFVAWKNGLSVFTIKVNKHYTPNDFEEDLQTLLKRVGCDGEKVCFIFDESNILESSFLERMNTLLSSGEVPGLFEGNAYSTLIHSVRQQAQYRGKCLQTDEEVYTWFTKQIRKNLHVVFTMNPASPDFHNRTATSPALFNRCVLDWFGDWPSQALFEVGMEFTKTVQFEECPYNSSVHIPDTVTRLLPSKKTVLDLKDAVVSTLVNIHESVAALNVQLDKQGKRNYVTPRHYLDFISHIVGMVSKKKDSISSQQSHLNTGLQKLEETEEEVKKLQAILEVKQKALKEKNAEANAKLELLVKDKQVAETQRKEVFDMKLDLEEKTTEIERESNTVTAELAVAKPALEHAKKSVTGMTLCHYASINLFLGLSPKDLEEIRDYKRPPALVMDTLEAVCILLGEDPNLLTWVQVRQKIMNKDFKKCILAFKTGDITEVRRTAVKKFLAKPHINHEKVQNASKACGPLFEWLSAHVNYSDIKNKVKPLKIRIRQYVPRMIHSYSCRLTEEAEVTKVRLEESTAALIVLEANLETLTKEYSTLVAHSEQIKAEMTVVQTKVDRSVSLLDNLSSERTRWYTRI